MNDLAFTRSRLIELYQRDNGWFPIHPNANNDVSFEFEIRFHLYRPISHASVINLDRWSRITALVYESIDRCPPHFPSVQINSRGETTKIPR